MKITKTIEVSYGACSDSISWNVGDDFCTRLSTYDKHCGRIPLTQVVLSHKNKTAYMILMEEMARKLFQNN